MYGMIFFGGGGQISLHQCVGNSWLSLSTSHFLASFNSNGYSIWQSQHVLAKLLDWLVFDWFNQRRSELYQIVSLAHAQH